MNITVIGRGSVGGGLASLWERRGHSVTRAGRDGGDASASDTILLAVPSNAIDEALEGVDGIVGKIVMDATNAFTGRTGGFESLAHQVKARCNGPVTKAFNVNFAALYNRIEDERVRPGMLYCGDEEAREVTEKLIQDAGYDPVLAGGLENARVLEDFLGPVMSVAQSSGGPFFYRFSQPGQL